MLRLLSLLVLSFAFAMPVATSATDAADPRGPLVEMLETSRTQGKGVTLFLPGHAVALVVTSIHGGEAVEGRSSEYSRVFVRLDQVLGAALQ